jgi:hypothetical protein
MRVERAGAARSASSVRRTAPSSGGGNFASAIGRASAPAASEAASSVSGVNALAGLDALVALQAADGDRKGRRRAMERGRSILDRLDELRLALLDGNLTESQIGSLLADVAGQRSRSDDPALNEVLDEIDLRAQVELAKYESRR